jgi:hypothetical protein
LVLPDVPVQCPPFLLGEEGLGQWRREVSRVCVRGMKLTDVWICRQGGAWEAVRGGVVVATEAAYSVREDGN